MEGAQQRGKEISNVARECVVGSRRNGMGSKKSHAATGAPVDRRMKERYARRRAHDDHGSPRDAAYHGIMYTAW